MHLFRFALAAGAVLAVVLCASSQEKPPGPIRLPEPVVPAVIPSDQPVSLPSDAWYVVESDVACLIFTSPGGTLSIQAESGPIRMRGKFVGGSGQVESKSFRGPFVYLVEGVKPGREELIVIPVGAKKENEAKRVTFVVPGIPPPKPIDPPSPLPDPAPIPAAGLHVLIVYEPNRSLPSAQAAILTGQATRELLRKACTTDARGLSAYRILPSQVEFGDELPLWKDAMARPRKSTPWVIVSNGKTGFEGPLPANERDFADLIARFGGQP
jgi:hypothetical protein